MSNDSNSVVVSGLSVQDITDDLSARQLAEVAFGTEVLIELIEPQADAGCLAVITGAQGGDNRDTLFSADGVDGAPGDGPRLRENGVEYTSLPREHFIVLGPANRDPGDLDEERDDVFTVGFRDPKVLPYLHVMAELMNDKQEHDSGSPLFQVRLDCSTQQEGNASGGPLRYSRTYRVLVRVPHQPMLHDEIQRCLDVASKYELACTASNVGIEIHRPEAVA